MSLVAALLCIGALLAVAIFAVVAPRARDGGDAVYAACLRRFSHRLCRVAQPSLSARRRRSRSSRRWACPGSALISASTPLAAFFLALVDLSGAVVSLYAIGYGRHEPEPMRVLPFYPAFLGRHDARPCGRLTPSPFLLSWEVDVARLLGAGHGAPSRGGERARRLSSISSWRASALFALLARLRPHRRPDGGYAFAAIRAHAPRADFGGAGSRAHADRRGIEGRACSAARLAAARPSRGAEPRVGADERRDDQGGGLRVRADRL